jgi:hypothetical protein
MAGNTIFTIGFKKQTNILGLFYIPFIYDNDDKIILGLNEVNG